ncbi:hypothetical protein V6N11_003181 [Hibiscus sabdariffa]|uniref:Reverse transcriptase zinc-binding domain-containing protein n=1 Tax=Hibiscus sabdariffa TaxID=183260 RepID=A0ABR2SCI1_9ROSI
MEIDGDCNMHSTEAETLNRLFIGCSFSKEVWVLVLKLCGIQKCVGSWEQELQWAVRLRQCCHRQKLISWYREERFEVKISVILS